MVEGDRNVWSWTVKSVTGRFSTSNEPSSRSRSSSADAAGESLMRVCMSGNFEEARRLLEARAEPNSRGEFGATPLMRAAEQGHTAIASLLLQQKARVGDQDDNGDSALLCACRMGHAEVAKILLAAGADAGLSNRQGRCSLDAALEARDKLNRREVADLLLAHRQGDALEDPSGGDSLSTLNMPRDAGNGVQIPRSDTAASFASIDSFVSTARGTPTSSQAPVLRLSRDMWAADRNYPECHECKSVFTLWNRRHHCRICGLVFCERCSSNSVSTSSNTASDNDNDAGPPPVQRVRVCNNCAHIHAAHPNGSLYLDERGPIETREVAATFANSLVDRFRLAAMPLTSRAATAASNLRHGYDIRFAERTAR